LEGFEEAAAFIKKIDLTLYWGEDDTYQYGLIYYRFAPEED
jgi:hypothetical protein